MSRFSAKLLDHFQSPRNAGPIEAPTVVGRATWGTGGPRVELYLTLDDMQRVTRAGFAAFGCGVTIAACSALTECVVAQPVTRLTLLDKDDVIRALDGLPPDKEFCAELVVAALADALAQLPARGEPHA